MYFKMYQKKCLKRTKKAQKDKSKKKINNTIVLFVKKEVFYSQILKDN